MNNTSSIRWLALLMVSLWGLIAGGCTVGDGGEPSTSRTERAAVALAEHEATADSGEITDSAKCNDAPFLLSGKTGEAALWTTNNVANPAQSAAPKRGHSSQRSSLASIIAEHSSSTVMACRFGLSAIKHITNNGHSLLLRIRVLRI